jgi:hypothetical protein
MSLEKVAMMAVKGFIVRVEYSMEIVVSRRVFEKNFKLDKHGQPWGCPCG